MAKEEMKREINESRARDVLVQRLLNALHTLPVDGAMGIFDKLRQGETIESIAAPLDSSQDDPQAVVGSPVQRNVSPADQRTYSHPHSSTSNVGTNATTSTDETYQSNDNRKGGTPRTKAWTDVGTEKLRRHLMALYFTWIHPTHMLFSEQHFVDSYEKGYDTHCSVALVNAICAMACNYLHPDWESNMRARNTAGTGVVIPPVNVKLLRHEFMSEAHHRMRAPEYGRITTLQALALMSLVDAGTGESQKARMTVRKATQYLLNAKPHRAEEVVVWQITVWGIYTLDV
jgi:Fungal specific transcription factor domain